MVIKYFSWIKEYIGKSEEEIILPDHITNVDQLIDLGLYIDRAEVNFDQIMVVVVESPGDGMEILKNINPNSGPICSLWVEGYYITDNIENEITNYNI